MDNHLYGQLTNRKTMSVKIIYSKSGKYYGQEAFIQLEGDWSQLINGDNLFFYNNNLKEWNENLSALKYGNSMFNRCALFSFNGDLSSLIDGGEMFNWSSLESFTTTNLLNLENGQSMFGKNPSSDKSIISFSYDLPSLRYANYMFNNCVKLVTFKSKLDALTNAFGMFSGCESLTTFTSNLGSLTDGTDMFNGCKLNVSSVANIASTIKTHSGGEIRIDIDDTLSNSNKDTIRSHFTTIEGRGWTVDSNLPAAYALSEDGEPIEDTSVYVKLEEANDYHCTHTDKDGNKVILRNAKYVGGPRQHEWTLFASLEGAEQFFGLTRIVDELNNNT